MTDKEQKVIEYVRTHPGACAICISKEIGDGTQQWANSTCKTLAEKKEKLCCTKAICSQKNCSGKDKSKFVYTVNFPSSAKTQPPRRSVPVEEVDRAAEFKRNLNEGFSSILKIPQKDYFAEIGFDDILQLKSILNNINNYITDVLRLSLVELLVAKSIISAETAVGIRNTSPSENGYDLKIQSPVKIIAEVKCNIPINSGDTYGGKQKEEIIKDIKGLLRGKKKEKDINPCECIKFLGLYDSNSIKSAFSHLMTTRGAKLAPSVEIVENLRNATLGTEKVYIVFLNNCIA